MAAQNSANGPNGALGVLLERVRHESQHQTRLADPGVLQPRISTSAAHMLVFTHNYALCGGDMARVEGKRLKRAITPPKYIGRVSLFPPRARSQHPRPCNMSGRRTLRRARTPRRQSLISRSAIRIMRVPQNCSSRQNKAQTLTERQSRLVKWCTSLRMRAASAARDWRSTSGESPPQRSKETRMRCSRAA